MTDPMFKSNTRFFFALSVTYLLIVILGFAPTFYLRAFVGFENQANIGLPAGLIFHGVIMTCWYVLFAFQSFLIRRGDVLLHRKFGVVGIALASLVVITSIITNVGIASKAIDDGGAEFVIVANFASLVLFSVFFSAAIAFRKKPDSHKRLMTCASLFT